MFGSRGILPYFDRLNLRRIFPAAYFFNGNLLVERVRVLLSEKELSPLADDNPKIFKKSNIDRHVEKLSTV